MIELPTIKKSRTLPSSQDYNFLLTTGMKYIEDLSHRTWSDYNTHDPGITILEALCYAITELGYRAGFDMKDLLTKDGNFDLVDGQAFFTARKILTNNPLTITDYRKLLVDTTGIHNAFLFAEARVPDAQKNSIPVNEIPIYANCKDDKLQFTPTSTTLFLNGLYRVLLDLDYDDTYGDLNHGDVVVENPPVPGKFYQAEFSISNELPSWKNADFNFAAFASVAAQIQSSVVIKTGNNWKIDLTLTNSWATTFEISIPKKPEKTIDTSDVQQMFDQSDFVANIFTMYLEKISLSRKIVAMAIKKLNEQRNLCEDFLSVTTIDDEEIAFCFDVDVTGDSDIEKIEAEIFYNLENYLNPSVNFYSLQELMTEGMPVDEIFEGPKLDHGFIKASQLENTQLRTVIHTSDIINLLMDINGVKAIRNFVMTKFDGEGNAVVNFKGLKWCMEITALHKPILSIGRSKILLFKNKIPFIARYAEVRDTIALLHAQQGRAKLNGIGEDLAAPVGNKRDTESFWPVQYDFPQTYGIGEHGLPPEASEQRIAQQRQLKAYMLFYEQILADFFSQLSNAHELFSTKDIKHTYNARFLGTTIKETDILFRRTPANAARATMDKLFDTVDSTSLSKNDWQQLYEPKHIFEERRGRFLDHLLARFGESFNDYVLLMYSINFDERTQDKIDCSEITKIKLRTLTEFDIISSARGAAYNYYPQLPDLTLDTAALWNTNNVSGLEKRISLLTGIKDYTRRFLYCIKNIEHICTEITENGQLKCKHSFSFISRKGVKMISEAYDDKTAAETDLKRVIEGGGKAENYAVSVTPVVVTLLGIMKSETPINDQTEADEAIADMAAEFANGCGDPLGLHLIEHILLRPRDNQYDLMQVCLDECDCPCELDPYSFRASVVLPCWPKPFDNMTFRKYFEDKIREEAPAHVMLKVCWLSNDLMREFEVRYKMWVDTLASYSSDKQANAISFINANNAMIDILNQLHSEYPTATLHDCDESKEGSNTVVLGKTVLGTYKN